MKPHGAEAVGHPDPFGGFPIQHWITKEKGLDLSLNPVTDDNIIWTTMFPWETVPSSKKVIHITIGCVVRDSVLESRFIN